MGEKESVSSEFSSVQHFLWAAVPFPLATGPMDTLYVEIALLETVFDYTMELPLVSPGRGEGVKEEKRGGKKEERRITEGG